MMFAGDLSVIHPPITSDESETNGASVELFELCKTFEGIHNQKGVLILSLLPLSR